MVSSSPNLSIDRQQRKFFPSKSDLCSFGPWVNYFASESALRATKPNNFHYDWFMAYEYDPRALFTLTGAPAYEHNLFQQSWLTNVIDEIADAAESSVDSLASYGHFNLFLAEADDTEV